METDNSAKEFQSDFQILHIFQYGPRPRGDVRAIRFGVVRAHVENGLRPRGLLEDALTVAGFDLEAAFAAVDQVPVLLADEGGWFILYEKLSQ